MDKILYVVVKKIGNRTIKQNREGLRAKPLDVIIFGEHENQ